MRHVAAELAEAYAFVRAVRDSPPEDAGATNVVFFASEAPVDWATLALSEAAADPVHGSQEWVAARFPDWEVASCASGTCALSWRGERATWSGPAPPPGPGYDARVAASLANITGALLPPRLRAPAARTCAATLAARWRGSPCLTSS